MSNQSPLHIAIVTAGGAGMFCGSCMHDNTWARALIAAGAEVSLIPTYTPIRVDEENQSVHHVFFGGINVYLDERFGFWRRLPRTLTRWLDQPWVLKLVSGLAVSSNARQLGTLTLSMLEGEQGPHARLIDELARFLADLNPDVVFFSNALQVGAVRRIKELLDCPVYGVLQGDDVFLEDLLPEYRDRALAAMRARVGDFDGFFVHSDYYRRFMGEYLQIPDDKFHSIPLGIDLAHHDGQPRQRGTEPFTVGYFARICPEKGLHQLVDAVDLLRARRHDVRLVVGGYLGARDKTYFREIAARTGNWGDAFDHVGSPTTHAAKTEILKSLHVLSVPTVYREPKGIYVLEALANGVPVVQPRHGAFPEIVEATGGGLLVAPGDALALADALESLMSDEPRRMAIAAAGRESARALYDASAMARATMSRLNASQQKVEGCRL